MNEKKNPFLKTLKQLRAGSFLTTGFFVVYLISMVLELGTISGIIAIVGTLVGLYVFFSDQMYEGEDKTRSFTWGVGAMTIMLAMFAYGTIKQWLGL